MVLKKEITSDERKTLTKISMCNLSRQFPQTSAHFGHDKIRNPANSHLQYQKVVVQLDPDKNMWTPAKIVQYPTGEGRSYSLRTIHGGVYTRNRIFIKPDLTATEAPIPKPSTKPVATRPTRIIKKPDRLIESK